MLEGALGAAAVVPAACVELFGPSPDNCSGIWGLRVAGAPILLLPTEDPVVAADPLIAAPAPDDVDPPADAPAENEEEEGSVDVGTLSGSVPMFGVVWARTAVTRPKQMIAVRIVRCIAFSCTGSRRGGRAAGPAMQDNAWSIKSDHQLQERCSGNLAILISKIPAGECLSAVG